MNPLRLKPKLAAAALGAQTTTAQAAEPQLVGNAKVLQVADAMGGARAEPATPVHHTPLTSDALSGVIVRPAPHPVDPELEQLDSAIKASVRQYRIQTQHGARELWGSIDEATRAEALRRELTPAELVALVGYTEFMYYPLNHALMSADAGLRALVEPYRALLARGLEKLPTYSGEVRRYTHLRPSFGRERFAVDQPVRVPMFMSTTKASSESYAGAEWWKGWPDHLVIQSSSGRDLSLLSRYSEDEVLFPPDVPFVTRAIKPADESAGSPFEAYLVEASGR